MNEKGKPEKRTGEYSDGNYTWKCEDFDKGHNKALDIAEAYWKPQVEKLEKELIKREMYANDNAYKPIEKYNVLLQELQTSKTKVEELTKAIKEDWVNNIKPMKQELQSSKTKVEELEKGIRRLKNER